ncbi:MAG TPA: tetratricopeptide repeat protein [Candidatus Cybelea sp.]|nr:tetratricopeptide repeat protein [Candidatus Cybelea sp.]
MRWVVGAVVTAAIVAFGAVQAGSDAFASGAAAAGTFPTLVPPRLGRAVYTALDRIAPAPYVETTLAADALAQGDVVRAQQHALRLPASPARDELLARIAWARGEQLLALEYFLAAADADAVQTVVEERAARNPADGYRLERLLETRLALIATHPDAMAEAYWRMGRLANREAWIQVPGSPAQRAWLRRARADFESAVTLSPLSERYVIEAANQEDLIGNRRRAAELFRQAADMDPASADALAGLGVIAFENGDRKAAALYLQRARTLDSQSLMVRALEHDFVNNRVIKGPVR